MRRRKTRVWIGVGILAGALLAAYGVHAASYLSAFSVERIEVEGVQKIDPSIIESYVESQLNDGSFHYISRRNIFAYPRAVIEDGIAASFPRVRDASLSRATAFSRVLRVRVTERESYALWCAGAPAPAAETASSTSASAPQPDCYAMDESGFVFTGAATTTRGEFASPYTFTGNLNGNPVGKTYIPGQMPFVLAFLRILQQETNLIPSRVDVLEDQDFMVYVEQGYTIKASFGQDGMALARNLELVLSSQSLRDRLAELESIDLRFGNRVYYKMKGEELKNI